MLAFLANLARAMPSRKIEQQLESLSELRKHPPSEQTIAALRKALSDPVNLVVAKAAAIAAELQLRSLLPDLRKAFERLFKNGRDRDPQCWGKNALSKAMKDLGHADSADFLRGLHHVQMEPVWGGEEDTATVLRGACALALVQCTDITRAEVFRHLVNAITDPTATVREDIARAIEQMEGEEAALLLRLKARIGDKEPRASPDKCSSHYCGWSVPPPFPSSLNSSAVMKISPKRPLSLSEPRVSRPRSKY